jgi:hypothetical protein
MGQGLMAEMSLSEWLDYGIANKFVSAPFCEVHEGIPLTLVEEQALDEGVDPDEICVTAMRVYKTLDEATAVIENNPKR